MKVKQHTHSEDGWERRKDSRRYCYAWLALFLGVFMIQ